MIDRDSERFIRRLETEFSSGGGVTHRGISSDLSERGIFIRSRHGFGPGTTLDITIYLPDGRPAKVRGIVRRTVKTDSTAVKNGMGIEILDKDANYINFLKTFTDDNFLIITCMQCRTKNKVPKAKLHMGPKCGNCKAGLKTN